MPLQKEQDFYDLALRYCSRRETSAFKMKQYLTRKFKEWHPEQAKSEPLDLNEPWWMQAIEATLNKLKDRQIINDQRYAEILRREYERRGKGKRYIQLKLKEKGLEPSFSQYEADPERELEAAISVASKQLQRSQMTKITDRFLLKRKLLQKLVSSGFDFDIAQRAVASILLTHNK